MNYLIINPGSTSLKINHYKEGVWSEEVINEEHLGAWLVANPDIICILRVVSRFRFSVPLQKITREITELLIQQQDQFPLHIPAVLRCINTILTVTNKLFLADDSWFHNTVQYSYPLTPDIADLYRPSGFHGFSHSFVAEQFGSNYKKIISCHLGGGSSICAIHNGLSTWCSMEWGVVDGVMGVARSGSLPPSVVLDLVENIGLPKTKKLLNKNSGWYGITGETNIKKIVDGRSHNPIYHQAVDLFVDSVVTHIMIASAKMGGAQLIVFGGGVGYGSEPIRSLIQSKLSWIPHLRFETVETQEHVEIVRLAQNQNLI